MDRIRRHAQLLEYTQHIDNGPGRDEFPVHDFVDIYDFDLYLAARSRNAVPLAKVRPTKPKRAAGEISLRKDFIDYQFEVGKARPHRAIGGSNDIARVTQALLREHPANEVRRNGFKASK